MAAIPRKVTKIVKKSHKKNHHSEFPEAVKLQNQTFTSIVLPKRDKHFSVHRKSSGALLDQFPKLTKGGKGCSATRILNHST